MKMPLRSLIVSLLIASTPALADDERLVAGSQAPGLTPKTMIRGEAPDLKSDRGCSVVVFWNSRESPSRQAIAPLNRLYSQLAPRGLRMLLVSEEDEETLRKLLKAGESNPYAPLASDKDGTSKADWLTAAKLETLPRAFVVGRGGRVLWIGSPLDESFESIVRSAIGRRYDPASRAKLEPSMRAAAKCAEVRNFAEAYKHYADAIEADSGIAIDAVIDRYKTTLLKEGNAAAANAWLIDTAKKRYAGDPEALAQFVVMLLRDPELKSRNLETAEQIIQAMGSSGEAQAQALAMQAMLASAQGDAQKAIDLQTEAWMAARVFEKPDLKRALDEYRAAAKRQSSGSTSGG